MSRMEILKGPYGAFIDEGAAYCITNWRTPRPWINVLANGTWGCVVSQAGGGYSWRVHSMLNRATRWNQDIVRDPDGKFLFLKDLDSEKVWSLTPQPLKPTFEEYSCTHGLGYTTFLTAVEGIQTEWTFFVPQDLPAEIWKVRIVNNSASPRCLSLMTYFEWLLGVFPDWHREFTKLFLRSSFDPSRNAMFVDSTLWAAPIPGEHGWNKDWPFRAFFLSNIAPASFTFDKEEFFGIYGGWTDAQAFTATSFSDRAGTGFDQVAAERFDLALAPGEEKTITFCLGISDLNAFRSDLARCREAVGNPDPVLASVKSHWLELCGRLKVNTPDPAVNVMLNYWLKYQAIACRILGRTAYYQCGGAFGFRDQLQDSQVFLTLEPSRTRDQIIMHAGHQKSDGTVHHWWHPISEEGHLSDISDDLLWLPFITFEYLRETDDLPLLDVMAPYLDGGSGPLLEHCERAIKKVLERISPRGLALMGEGDWNDGLNGVGIHWKGESIWLSHFFVGILAQFATLLCRLGKPSGEILQYEEAGKAMKEALLEHAWDGKWFIRATTDAGKVLGSKNCAEGKIYLNAQTWAVINQVVEGKKAGEVLDSVEKHLYKEYGVLLFTPAYTVSDKSIGYLTRYSPGIRENGGCYTHAAIWAMWAQAVAGRGDKVYETFRRLCPPLLSQNDPARYAGEPYATPGNIEGPESLTEGRGAWTWYSGSAAWLYKGAIEWMLGVSVRNGCLEVNPNIPDDWPGFNMERLHKGKRYRIEVTRNKPDAHEKFSVSIEEIA